MILKNPLDKDLEINFKGNGYVLPANGTLEVPEAVGAYWLTQIHQFLTVVPETVVAPAAVEETPAAVVETPTEVKAPDAAPAKEAKVKKGKK